MTEKLLPCPFCGGEAESKMYLWGHHAETHEPIWCYYIYCTSCDAMTDNVFKAKTEAIAAWNRRAQPENKPLTRDELREMDGEPVWVHEVTAEPIDGDYWAIIDANFTCAYGYGIGAAISPATDGKSRFAQTPFSDYSKTWLAYRYKPEEVQQL